MLLRLRCLLVWLAATGVALAAITWALSGVSLSMSGEFDAVVATVAGIALAGCAGWAWLVCTLVVAQATRGAGRVGRVRGVPTWAAHAVLAACGVAVLTTAPAVASYDVTHQPAQPGSVDGLPFPDRPVGPARAAAPSEETVVRAGDSLWQIAADRLASDASDADVAAATSALYELNRGAVGSDPDLIHPGLRLRTPGS